PNLDSEAETILTESCEIVQRALHDVVDLAETKEYRRPMKCPIRIEGNQVYVNGKLVPLDVTEEKRKEVLGFLRQLIEQRGGWISSTEIDKNEKLMGTRIDRIRKLLPPEINAFVESNRRKGYRIRISSPT